MDPAPEGWFDSHCHLQDRYLDPTPDRSEDPTTEVRATLGRALEAGVKAVVCIGTDAATSAQALSLVADARAGRLGERRPELWASVGQHPHEAADGTAEVAELLAEAVKEPGSGLVAVGECGLDYYYDHSPHPDQRRAFAEQIGLAHLHQLALVIHAREAWDDLFAVLDTEGIPPRTVLHCFTGGPAELDRCLAAGMYVSFSGIVTFKNAAEIREAAVRCPLERLLIETDSPFLAPVPYRGKTNEPAWVPLVGATVADLRGIELAVLATTSSVATRQVFGL